MADFICLALAQQQQQDSEQSPHIHDTSPPPTTSSRRSLNLSQGLLGRRFSRTLNQGHSSSELTPSSPSSDISLHVRIVPSIENSRRSLIFEVIDREIKAGTTIKIGRFTDRTSATSHISFKSKVVSRTHCEIWVDTDSKLYIRDTKSSSGTFLNHVRLGPANQESPPAEIHDGDIVQLGVDYQGGLEEMYRSVKMRFEFSNGQSRPAAYNMTAFQQLRNMTGGGKSPPPLSVPSSDPLVLQDQQQPHSHHLAAQQAPSDVDECCICLYALAPVQALFVAPCSHCYHFKCIRPLLESYPGFQCPICRGYSDLEASVAIEPEEVAEKYGLVRSPMPGSQPTTHEEDQSLANECERTLSQLTTSLDPVPVAAAGPAEVDPLTDANTNSAYAAPPSRGNSQPLSTNHHPLDNSLDQPLSNLAHEDEEDQDTPVPVERRSTFVFDEPTTPPPSSSTEPHQPRQTSEPPQQRRLSATNLVDKIKMAFSSEKRKMVTPYNPLRKQRSARYATTAAGAGAGAPTTDDEDGLDDRSPQHPYIEPVGSSSSSYASPSSSPPQRIGLLTRTLSATSNGGLADIDEEISSFMPIAH